MRAQLTQPVNSSRANAGDANVAIVGAGIVGLCTALALVKRGFRVTLYERDVPPPGGSADEAFFAWPRRGAAQFRHPHAFLGLMCNVLKRNYPDLLEDFLHAGARQLSFAEMLPPRLREGYQPLPEDDDLWVLMCRRATIETVLRRYALRQANLQIENRSYVTGLVTELQADAVLVRGLALTDRGNANRRYEIEADIVIDATGRASKFAEWLTASGVRTSEEVHDAEIVYYTRHYRLHDGVEEPSRDREDPAAGDLGYLKYGVFPGDNGHFALIVCVPNQETQLRQAVKQGAAFDEICRTIPGVKPWIDAAKASATTPSFGIGDIKAVWRQFDMEAGPKLLNCFAVGDAYLRTNPLYGRGCSTGVLHAHILAEVLAEESDPVRRVERFDCRTKEELRPIFDASLREDRNGIARSATLRGEPLASKRGWFKKWFAGAFGDALAAAAKYELHVHRGVMRTVNLMEPPGAFLKEASIRRTVWRYMLRGRKKNSIERLQRGLSRDEMLQFVAQRGFATVSDRKHVPVGQ